MSRPWYLRESSPGDGSADTGKARAPSGPGRTSHRLAPVPTSAEVLQRYRGTAVEDLLAYHNLGHPFRSHAQAEMLIAMCMDHRKMLRIPENFAFILRTGGGNLRRIEFKLSYAIAIGGVRAVCLIAHNHCGMVELSRRRDDFVRGLVENGGWDRRDAEVHFDASAPEFEIGDPVSFVAQEAQRLSRRYPKVLFAPLHYDVGDGTLTQVVE